MHEINQEFDAALEELVFNGDITMETSTSDLKNMLIARTQATEEQWQMYTVYCLQSVVERALTVKKERTQ